GPPPPGEVARPARPGPSIPRRTAVASAPARPANARVLPSPDAPPLASGPGELLTPGARWPAVPGPAPARHGAGPGRPASAGRLPGPAAVRPPLAAGPVAARPGGPEAAARALAATSLRGPAVPPPRPRLVVRAVRGGPGWRTAPAARPRPGC